MSDSARRLADEFVAAARRTKRVAVPRQEADSPSPYLRYRAERSLEAVLNAIGSDPLIRQTLY